MRLWLRPAPARRNDVVVVVLILGLVEQLVVLLDRGRFLDNLGALRLGIVRGRRLAVDQAGQVDQQGQALLNFLASQSRIWSGAQGVDELVFGGHLFFPALGRHDDVAGGLDRAKQFLELAVGHPADAGDGTAAVDQQFHFLFGQCLVCGHVNSLSAT